MSCIGYTLVHLDLTYCEYKSVVESRKMRPKGKVLQYFRETTENERIKYNCLFCEHVYTAKNVTRFAQHLVKNCQSCPIDVKTEFRKSDPQNSSSTAAVISSVSTEQPNGSTVDEKIILKAFAKAVYVTGMPLSIFEHPLWIEAFRLLKSDYKPPSRKILSTSYLEEEYEDMKNVISKKIDQSKVLHLAVDGWTNVRKDSIINIMVYTPAPFFHTSIEAETNRHTGEYLAEKISETMEEIGSEKFLGIISDNAANMKKCGKLLVDKYEKATWIGCLAHTLNLLIADILKVPEIHEVFTTVVDIVKCVLKSNIFCAEFKKIASNKLLNVTLVLPVKTRWGSYSHCLENFMKSKEILQTMAINENNRDFQKFKSALLEETTWSVIEKQINLFKPIVKWIFKLEGDACTIHLVTRALEEVESILISDVAKQIFTDEHLISVLQKFRERRQNCIKPLHLAAVILDPKNQGTSLKSEEYLDGCSAIMDIAEVDAQTILKEVSEYKCRNGIFEKEFVWQTAQSIEPVAWWQSLYPNCLLGKIALKILSVPATSASVERSFSTFSNIHTKKRNRLLTERCMKICYISHNWKLLYQKESLRKTAGTSMNESDIAENNSEHSQTDSSFDLETVDFMSQPPSPVADEDDE